MIIKSSSVKIVRPLAVFAVTLYTLWVSYNEKHWSAESLVDLESDAVGDEQPIRGASGAMDSEVLDIARPVSLRAVEDEDYVR